MLGSICDFENFGVFSAYSMPDVLIPHSVILSVQEVQKGRIYMSISNGHKKRLKSRMMLSYP